jgi:PBP1b-binding outer membrane lipoprotein LpoB
MKKTLLISLSILLLTGCSEKQAYEQALLEQMQKEPDVKDYNITPEAMVKCVFDTTSTNMPGFFTYDPYRRMTYDRYAKMINAAKAPDPKKAFEELTTLFGSPKKLSEAHTNLTESMMECYSLITDTRDKNPPRPK